MVGLAAHSSDAELTNEPRVRKILNEWKGRELPFDAILGEEEARRLKSLVPAAFKNREAESQREFRGVLNDVADAFEKLQAAAERMPVIRIPKRRSRDWYDWIDESKLNRFKNESDAPRLRHVVPLASSADLHLLECFASYLGSETANKVLWPERILCIDPPTETNVRPPRMASQLLLVCKNLDRLNDAIDAEFRLLNPLHRSESNGKIDEAKRCMKDWLKSVANLHTGKR